jgi:hypothetical protein
MPFEPVAKGSALGHGENIKVLSQAWGDRVTAVDRQDAAGDNVQPAGLFSTAPYVDPAITKAKKAQAEAEAEAEREAAWARSQEAIAPASRRDCARSGCKAPARKDSEFCRWHPEG